ncbi:RNA-splicing factor [Tilletia horrida]|uniref:RNA-splicing factor n=1 Tax=Tilletia horrida TaxID=155126 RepID=A0AAN6JR94_9BASI|nr:RNA-splicing factor [Tilletia horrida]
MYNGVGLQTARGSGTSGYVQRNYAALRHRDERGHEQSGFGKGKSSDRSDSSLRKPDKGILDHDKKRKVEVRCMELRDELEEKGIPEDEIEDRVSQLRDELSEALNNPSSAFGSSSHAETRALRPSDVHALQAAKALESERWKSALGVNANYEEGQGFSAEYREAQREQRKAERQRAKEERDQRREEYERRRQEERERRDFEAEIRDRRREDRDAGRYRDQGRYGGSGRDERDAPARQYRDDDRDERPSSRRAADRSRSPPRRRSSSRTPSPPPRRRTEDRRPPSRSPGPARRRDGMSASRSPPPRRRERSDSLSSRSVSRSPSPRRHGSASP